MPLGQGGQLDSQEYADIVAYILAQGGVPAGGEKLTPNSPMDRAVSLLDVAGAAIAPAASRVEQGKLYDTLKQPSTHKPTQTELDHADSSTDNWLMYNRAIAASAIPCSRETPATMQPSCIRCACSSSALLDRTGRLRRCAVHRHS